MFSEHGGYFQDLTCVNLLLNHSVAPSASMLAVLTDSGLSGSGKKILPVYSGVAETTSEEKQHLEVSFRTHKHIHTFHVVVSSD